MSPKTWLAAFAASILTTTAALGQAYPSKPISLVVPFAAGGPTDVIARIIADSLGKNLGQTSRRQRHALGFRGFHLHRPEDKTKPIDLLTAFPID